jgi:hypothetical protein
VNNLVCVFTVSDSYPIRICACRICCVLRVRISTSFACPFVAENGGYAGLADVVPFSDHSIALIVQAERDNAIINDPAIRTTVFAAGGVAAARASKHPAIAAAATSYHQACRRSAALQAAQGIRKPRRSKAKRQARQAEQVQQAQALVAAAKAAEEAAATEKRLRAGSQLAFDPKCQPKSNRGLESLVTSSGVPKPGVSKDDQPAGSAPIALPAPAEPHRFKRASGKKSILERITTAK